ncbi:MAG TPA: hypothetical protein VED63_12885 [Acidimicrobiales bacterium]|nr:hypothetical protein [Acidimicrobiales bacterium]
MEAMFCAGALVVHLAGQITCTEETCDIGWPDAVHHLIGPTACRTCYPSRETTLGASKRLEFRWGPSVADPGAN